MRRNEEKSEMDLPGALGAARRHLARGRIKKALDRLDRAAWERTRDLSLWPDHLVAAVRIAILCDRPDLAKHWIGRAGRSLLPVRENPLKQGLEIELRLLALRVHFSEEGPLSIDAKLEKAFGRIQRWKPWMVQFRWIYFLNRHRLDDLDEFLRRAPGEKIQRGTLEYATRLICLGIRLVVDRQSRRAIIVLESALRKLQEVPDPEKIHSRATTLAWLARAVAEIGDSPRALELMEEAEAISRRFRGGGLRYLVNTTNGYIHYSRGEYEEALRAHLDTCMVPVKRNSYHLTKTALALLYASQCALKLGSLPQARSLLSRARSLMKVFPYPALRGFLQLLRGDLQREAGTRAGFRKARVFYAAAEKIFKNIGTGQKWWLGLVHLSHGTLYLKEKNIAQALKQASLSLEIGKEDGALDIQAEGLLLKSFILLHEEAPRLDIYEMILRQMGVVRDPVVMFKVLANLYIYSWDLDEHLELTDLHLKQLSGLKDVLPSETYDRLYRTYVTERVVARFRRRFIGQAPGERRAALP